VSKNPNFAKCILGTVVLALLFIATIAYTHAPRSSAAALKSTNHVMNKVTTSRLTVGKTRGGTLQVQDPPAWDDVFQIDGDAADPDPANLPDDWNDLNPGNVSVLTSGSVTGPAGHAGVATFVSDPAIRTDLIYTGGGSKDFLDITSWLNVARGTGPAKDDVEHAYAAKYIDNVGTSVTNPNFGHSVLVFGGDRPTNNGDANIGFWFFQNAVGIPNPPNGTFAGTHANGDVFVLSAFSAGGGNSTPRVLVWVGNPSGTTTAAQRCSAFDTPGNPPSFIDPKSDSSSFPQGSLCDITLSHPNAAFAITNNTDVQVSWQYSNKDTKVTCTTAPCTIPAPDFFEGAIDLTDLGLAALCFNSFLLESRSSQDVDAVLKDFALGSFNTCAGLTVTKSASPTEACQGTPVSYTYSVTNTGAVPLDVSLLDDNGTSGTTTDDFYVSGLTSSGGACTITAASPPPGSIPTSTVAAGATVSCTLSGVTLGVGTTTNNVHAHGVNTGFGSTADADASATVIIDQSPTCSMTVSPAQVCAGGSATFTANPTSGTGPFTFLWDTGATTQSITVTNATSSVSHTVTITDSKGCTTSCSGSLIVNPNPTCGISGPAQTCEGTLGLTYSSTGSNIATHSWSISGNGTIVGSSTGSSVTVNAGAFSNGSSFTLTDNITSTAGCTSSCSTTVAIKANPVVTIGTVACSTGNSITLQANATVGGNACADCTFVWTKPDATTATGSSLDVSAPGTYSVTATEVHNGFASCTGTTSKHVGLCAP
jgi:hypothetical protein